MSLVEVNVRKRGDFHAQHLTDDGQLSEFRYAPALRSLLV